MKTFGFVVEVVISVDGDKTFIVRMPNGNVIGILQSVGAAADCIDYYSTLNPAPSTAVEK